MARPARTQFVTDEGGEMRARREVRGWVAAAVAATALVHAPARAGASPIATVCAVAGTVAMTPGSPSIPPGIASGSYSFSQVLFVCAGGMNGMARPTSTGKFGELNCGAVPAAPGGSFCGTFNSGAPLVAMVDITDGPVESNAYCAGTVGGASFGNWNQAAIAAGQWSFTFGALITGGMTCATSNVMSGGVGVIALVAEPITVDSSAGIGTGDCVPPPSFIPPPAWACSLAVEGVAVLAGTDT